MDVHLKRAYEAPSPADGYRVLVDRLWPRGVSRDRARLDEWAREWFASYAQPNLAGHTLAYYARAWDLHVLPRIGELELRSGSRAIY